ncbi:radiation-inducible immediate-early gene IEX-1 [Sebastes umbrosus]|uniref:radiation-inducible immediate-early gene IEX-1 n=1 Tax=Sebastes umbrosus TaxID=72105 RepID=UPI0018A054E4|nr:radiation-inducible immediate-early gene IEX-1 [Sebastes umbrosus]
MYSRTNSVTLVKQEFFGSSRTSTRSTEPEVFTFERVPTQATAVRSYVPIRPKKRCTRVMYPAKVRMHLPPPETNRAKRWLVLLVLVLLWQIYTEEPCLETDCDYQQGFSFHSDQQQLSDRSAGSELLSSNSILQNTCPETEPGQETQNQETESSFQQSAGKSYVVALLVYHRLGKDN